MLYFHFSIQNKCYLVPIYPKAKIDQGCLLLLKVLSLSSDSWSYFCGPFGRRRECYWCSETWAVCVPPHLAFCSSSHNSGLCWLWFITSRHSQHWHFLFPPRFGGEGNRIEKVRRNRIEKVCNALSRHGRNLTVQCLMGYMRPMKSVLLSSTRPICNTSSKHPTQMLVSCL